MACHRSRSLGAGARISRRCRSLASICHCSRNRSICLTLTTIPSPTPYRANPATLQIYRITLRISPWLWFSTRSSPGYSTGDHGVPGLCIHLGAGSAAGHRQRRAPGVHRRPRRSKSVSLHFGLGNVRVWLKYHIGTGRWPAASLLSLSKFSNIERKLGWLQPSAVLPAKQPSSKVPLGNCKSSCSCCTYAAGNVQELVSSNEASIGLAALTAARAHIVPGPRRPARSCWCVLPQPSP